MRTRPMRGGNGAISTCAGAERSSIRVNGLLEGWRPRRQDGKCGRAAPLRQVGLSLLRAVALERVVVPQPGGQQPIVELVRQQVEQRHQWLAGLPVLGREAAEKQRAHQARRVALGLQCQLLPASDEFIQRHKVGLERQAVEKAVRVPQRALPGEVLSGLRARRLEDRRQRRRAAVVRRREQRARAHGLVKPHRRGERRWAPGGGLEGLPEAGARSGEGRLGGGWTGSVEKGVVVGSQLGRYVSRLRRQRLSAGGRGERAELAREQSQLLFRLKSAVCPYHRSVQHVRLERSRQVPRAETKVGGRRVGGGWRAASALGARGGGGGRCECQGVVAGGRCSGGADE
eukprot:scaffold4107_cov95-Isochrysis_galbana.AAC.7